MLELVGERAIGNEHRIMSALSQILGDTDKVYRQTERRLEEKCDCFAAGHLACQTNRRRA